MDKQTNRWADRQILWGWAFLIAIIILLFYLFFAFVLPLGTGPAAPTVDGGSGIADITATPPATSDVNPSLVAAEATLAAAPENPSVSAAAVRHAAETVVAVTAEAKQAALITPQPVDPQPTVTLTSSTGSAQSSGLGWVEWILGAIPALTAIVTFVGLVFSSIMKWRTDLREFTNSRPDVDYERERLQFELQKQRFELDCIKTEMEMEQQRLALELERERMALAELRQGIGELEGSPEFVALADDDRTASALGESVATEYAWNESRANGIQDVDIDADELAEDDLLEPVGEDTHLDDGGLFEEEDVALELDNENLLTAAIDDKGSDNDKSLASEDTIPDTEHESDFDRSHGDIT